MRHRSALITAGLITAVVLVAAVAIGANLGLLTTAGSDSVGQLSASTSEAAAEPASSDVQGDPESAAPQRFVVERAGHVDVVAHNEEIRIDDVHAKTNWTWKLVQSSGRTATVTFTSGSTTYRFVAKLHANGSLVARVEEPVTKIVGGTSAASSGQRAATPVTRPPASTSSQPSNGDDDDHYESDEHDSDEHEGGEDDD
jgi:hypothetical protein